MLLSPIFMLSTSMLAWPVAASCSLGIVDHLSIEPVRDRYIEKERQVSRSLFPRIPGNKVSRARGGGRKKTGAGKRDQNNRDRPKLIHSPPERGHETGKCTPGDRKSPKQAGSNIQKQNANKRGRGRRQLPAKLDLKFNDDQKRHLLTLVMQSQRKKQECAKEVIDRQSKEVKRLGRRPPFEAGRAKVLKWSDTYDSIEAKAGWSRLAMGRAGHTIETIGAMDKDMRNRMQNRLSSPLDRPRWPKIYDRKDELYENQELERTKQMKLTAGRAHEAEKRNS